MPTNLNPYIQQLSWEEAREMILKVNPEFVKEVDNVDLPKTCSVFKVKYRYGDYLMENGTIMLRNQDGENVPITHPELPEVLRKELMYAPTLPMGMVLNKTVEAYFKSIDGRIVPRILMPAGYIFALTAIVAKPEVYFDKGSHWNLTAGTRSVYSIPKISIAQKHQKLFNEFGIGYLPPKSLNDQWYTFKELMASERLSNKWEMDVLYFSKEWIEICHNGSAPAYGQYLFRKAYEILSFFSNNHLSDFLFSQIEADSNIRRQPNNVNCLRHVINMAGSFLPGLSFNCDNDSFPKDLLYLIYRDVYGLEHEPQFLSLKYFNPRSKDSIYYSLALPMQIDYYPNTTTYNSKFSEIRDMAYSFKRMLQTIKTKDYGLDSMGASVLRGLNDSEIKIYHSHQTKEKGIHQLCEMPENKEATRICSASPIYRGLFGIHPKSLK